MADAMKSAGYATGIFGKWHLGGADGCNPGEQGFDVYNDSAKGGNPNRSKGMNRVSRIHLSKKKEETNVKGEWIAWDGVLEYGAITFHLSVVGCCLKKHVLVGQSFPPNL